jgi:formylmethanofuran dehydrogenase subunit E
MSAEVWDDRGVNEHPTAKCQACGEVVWVWVAFEGYGKGWQVCEPCLRDAVRALDEHQK